MWRSHPILVLGLALVLAPASHPAASAFERASIATGAVDLASIGGQDEEDAEVAEINDFFSRMVKAQNEQGAELEIDRYFDIDAMVGQLLEAIDLEENLVARDSLNLRLRQRLEQEFGDEMLHGVRSQVAAVDLDNANRKAVVMLRTWRRDGVSIRQRYWLVRKEANWRIVDVEDVTLNLRMSTLMAAIAGEVLAAENPLAMAESIAGLEKTISAINSGDYYAANEHLLAMDGLPLPASVESVRWVLKSSVAVYFFDPNECLRCLDKAIEYQADIPIVRYNQAVAFNMLGQSKDALEAAQQFTDRYGSDADAQREIGIALQELGRDQEALEAFRDGLKDTPNSVDNLAYLGLLLPDDEKEEIVRHFQTLTDPVGSFHVLADAFYSNKDVVALERIIETFRESHPDEPSGNYYAAQLHAERDEYEQAVELLAQVLDLVPDQYAYLELFVDCCLEIGRPIYAYDLATDKREAFDRLANSLIASSDWPGAQLLLERHHEVDSEDPNYHLMRGEFFFYQDDFNAADKAYAEVDTDDQPWLTEMARLSRVACWFHLDKSIEALSEFQSAETTFNELAEMMLAEERYDDILKLTHAYRELAGEDFYVRYWELVLTWQEQDYERAVEDGIAILTEAEEAETNFFGWRTQSVESMIVRSLVRLKRYPKALKIATCSTDRDGDPYYEAIVFLASGRIDDFKRAFNEMALFGYSVETLLADEDMGPILEQPKMQALREWIDRASRGAEID